MLAVVCTGCDTQQSGPKPASGKSSSEAPGGLGPKTPEDAQMAFRDGDVALAAEIAQEILIREPSNLDAGLILVALAVERSQPAEAAELLLQLAESQPEKKHLLMAQAADLFDQAGEHGRAINVLQTFVDQHPNQLTIRRRLAEILNSRGFRFDANEHLRYLAGRMTLSPRELIGLINPTFTWVNFTKKPDITDQQLISQSGVLNVIAALRSKGDVREALELLERSDLLAARHPAAIAMQGWLLSSNQEFEALAAWAAEADDGCRRYPAYWLGLGNLMLHLGRESAVTCFAEALRREPSSMEAAAGLAQALAAQDRAELVGKVKQRQKDLNEAQALAYNIGSSGRPNPALAGEMGRVMNAIGRPIESLAWQEALYALVAPGAEQLNVLRRHKQQLLEKLPSGIDASLVICGIDSREFATVDSDLASGRVQRPDIPAGAENRTPLETLAPSTPVFTDIAKSVGIEMRHLNAPNRVEKEFRLFEALGSGVACLDFDLDGNVDLYLGQAGGEPPYGSSAESNRLMRSQDNRFQNVSEPSASEDFGYTHGVTAGDWNQDGFPDLVIGNVGVNRLLINQGDGTFRDASAKSGQLPAQWSRVTVTTSVALADVTGDALPDLFETNYVDDPAVFDAIEYGGDGKPVVLPGPKHFSAADARVFVTAPDGRLVLDSLGEKDAIASTGLGILITDLDNDRQNEVFVANDQNPNHLWKHLGSESGWTNLAPARGCAYGTGGKPFACMGIAAADYDRNGRVDLHVTNFSGECSNLYLQNDSGVFVDRALAYRLDEPTVSMVGFGTQAFDYDNNAGIDLVIGNGHIEDFRSKGQPFQMPTQILAREGDSYVQRRVEGDADYWGSLHLGRSVAILDWNRDGRVDVAVTDLSDDFVLLENRTESEGHFVQLELIGTKSERDAVGAKITVESGGKSVDVVVQTGDGYLCRNESVLFLGLGAASDVDRLTIRWPSGDVQTLEDLDVDARVLVIENAADLWQRTVH
jgi:thioredoxin-like negative regulator of GroEL